MDFAQHNNCSLHQDLSNHYSHDHVWIWQMALSKKIPVGEQTWILEIWARFLACFAKTEDQWDEWWRFRSFRSKDSTRCSWILDLKNLRKMKLLLWWEVGFWFLQQFRLNQVCILNGIGSLFIEEMARRMWSKPCAWIWTILAWACMIMHKAQNQSQMTSELIPKWNGRVIWKAKACVMNSHMLCIIELKTSPLRKYHLPNPNMIMWVMVGKVLM